MNFNKETKKATEKQYLNGKGKLKVSKVRVSSSLMTNQQKPGKSRKWLGIFLKKKKKLFILGRAGSLLLCAGFL